VTTLKWQLKIAERFVKAGSALDISERWQNGGKVFLKVREIGSGDSSHIWVRSLVNIGGKNYLLLEQVDSSGEELVVARLVDHQRLCAIDPDRLSSLSNALTSFMESHTVTTVAELEGILGALPTVPEGREIEMI
jgi:hypothetical protein